MSDDRLIVLMHDRVAGVLSRAGNGTLRFEHDDAYARDPGSTPVSLTMPLTVRVHRDAVVRPWIAGLLPEDDGVRELWARHYGVSTTPFTLLGTPVGEDCAGAVRFCREPDLPRLLDRGASVEWLTDAEVEAAIRDLRRDATTWLGRTFSGQFSLAGAQAKTALVHDGGRWGRPHGDMPTTHILKPAVAGFADHEIDEHLCLDAARRAGLLAARTRVVTLGAQRVVAIERYDRVRIGDRLVRVHQEDTCQALGLPPTRKYEAEGGPSALDIIRLLRRHLSRNLAEPSVERFVDSIAWNWIIAGTDAHAKNTSLLLSGPEVRLAPMYDVASALPYGHERRLRMAMRVGSDRDLHQSRRRWEAAASEWSLDRERLGLRVRDLVARAPDAFSDAANDPAVTALGSPAAADLAAMVAKRCAVLRKRLEAEDPIGGG
jgi:serine/threonine-protein kinase HipA